MTKKIGIVTGGGDCPGLNAVIRATAKAAAQRGWETVGILGGYEGLLEPQQTRLLDYHALDGLLVRGGTILGTANRGRFSAKVGHGETRQLPREIWRKRGMEWKARAIRARFHWRRRLFEHRPADARAWYTHRRGSQDDR